VFLLHQPSDVGEEESAGRVVRVRVCLAELVVDPMVSDPMEDRVLRTFILKAKMDVRRYTK
jgi:hypothetical protein